MRRPLGFAPVPTPAGAIFIRLAVSRPATANGGRIMSDRAIESGLPIPFQRALLRDRSSQKGLNALTAELREALDREQVLLQEKHELSERQVMLAHEFEHRLVNGLQLIVSLLSMQSRTAT